MESILQFLIISIQDQMIQVMLVILFLFYLICNWSPKNLHFIKMYSLSCHSKPVWFLLFCETQKIL